MGSDQEMNRGAAAGMARAPDASPHTLSGHNMSPSPGPHTPPGSASQLASSHQGQQRDRETGVLTLKERHPTCLLSVMKMGTPSQQENIYQKEELIKHVEEIIKCPWKD